MDEILLILAVDTSTTSGSIALTNEGTLVAEMSEPKVEAHAKWLMRSIDELFSTIEPTIEDVDLFAIANGPGSFTGLRIGVSTIKALAWSLDRPVVGVSTLSALAMNITEVGALICPVLDARKKELYTALYRISVAGGLEEVMADRAIAPEKLFAEIDRLSGGESPIFLGLGLEAYKEQIESSVKGAVFAPEELWRIKAVNVARLATGERAKEVEASELAPLYKRRSEAEINVK
jgi:tRNA threonylcarbamoyladenosine biosynthesis protein TsaB